VPEKLHPSTKAGLLMINLALIVGATGCDDVNYTTQPELDNSNNQPTTTETAVMAPSETIASSSTDSSLPISTPTPTKTTILTPTASETPTPTNEPTSTPDANSIAQEMGYGQDGYGYSKDGNFIIRDLNGERVAKLDNGEWVQTDMAERYQPLLDGAIDDFIDERQYRGDWTYPNDAGIHARVIKPIYTGVHHEEEYFFEHEQKTVTLTVLEAVIPTNANEVLKLQIALGSSDLEGNLLLSWMHPGTLGEHDYVFAPIDEVEKMILPGEQLNIWLVTSRASGTMPGEFCYENTGYCTIDYYLSEEIRKNQGNDYSDLIRTLESQEEMTQEDIERFEQLVISRNRFGVISE
jgi:hypothetical protein